MPWQYPLSNASAPTGPAGGDLAGTYPNPTIGAGKVTSAKMGSVLARAQLLSNAQGIIADRGNYENYSSSSSTVTSQLAVGCLVGLRAGDVIAGIILRVKIAAAGTAATTARFGIADATGVMLAVSGNLNTAASWPTGATEFPLASPYPILADGGYFICCVVNGSWGTTQPQIANRSGLGSLNSAAVSGFAPFAFSWPGRTDLPTVGNPLTITTADSSGFYLAAYGTPVI